MSDRTLSRRQFVASGVAAVGAMLGSTRARGEIWADDAGEWAPNHVTHVGDDWDELEIYQPRLITNASDRRQMVGMFGAYMDSDRYDTRAYTYWLRYSHQDSLLDVIPFLGERFAGDAHLGDHEPFTAFVDPDTGDIEDVLYTGYHHYGVALEADEANLSSEATDDPTHTPLKVVSPHHHYRLGDEDAGVLASNVTDTKSFLDGYPDWDDQGIWDSSNREAVTDPWAAREIGHWWEEGTWDHRLARIRLALTIRDRHDDLIEV